MPSCRTVWFALFFPVLCPAQSAPQLTQDASRSARDSRGGNGQILVIRSAILNETRTVGVVVPASYRLSAPTRRYPVTIVLDGESSLAPTAAVADELTRNAQIPEAIIVAVENTNRLRDLTPPGLSVSGSSTNEGGDRFLDFLERELLPAIDRQFRGGLPRTLIGHSSGGIIANYAAATRDTYRCVIALDAPTHLGGNWLANKLTARARTAAAPLRYVSYQARFGWTDSAWSALRAAAPASWKLHRESLRGETHESIPMLGTYLALREVFSDYAAQAAPVAPTTSILPYYAAVGAALGVNGESLIPPRRLLTTMVEDLLMEGRGAAARMAFEMQKAGYGAPADSAQLLAEIADVERQPAPTETVEGLLATPFPTPEEARAIIGEWAGNVWMNEDELTPGVSRNLIRISIRDGRVVGETESHPAPGVVNIREWTYLRMTPNGFSFGYMNGMRPRAVLVHDGVIKDGVVSGVIRFGGVSFKESEGAGTVHFSYRKK